MMEQREKLIELIGDSLCCPKETDCVDCEYKKYELCTEAMVADHLLANGVVVLPCKVGDTVYEVFTWHDCTSPYPCYCCDEEAELAEKTCEFHKIRTCIFERRFDYTMIDEISKTIFLAREEAEKALEKRKGGDE